jgi:ferredoxin--NADP+ reductase
VRHQIEALLSHELLGASARSQLRYYPTVTREPHRNRGRLTSLIESGRLFRDLGLPQINVDSDRAMLCGSPAMLSDTRSLLDARGFSISPNIGEAGDYVIERAFVSH